MQLVVCLLVGLAASVEDLWRRRISNRTVLAGLAAGLAIQVHLLGWLRGPVAWGIGAAVGFAIFLIFFLAGGMGGGDVKLMAAFGACLGAGQILRAALLAAIVGALVACGYLLWHWVRRRMQGRSASPAASAAEPSIPYAPAIFIGTLLSFIGA